MIPNIPYPPPGIPPWSYLLAIISSKSIADPDIQAKAMSLINKVCSTTLLSSLPSPLPFSLLSSLPFSIPSSLLHPFLLSPLLLSLLFFLTNSAHENILFCPWSKCWPPLFPPLSPSPFPSPLSSSSFFFLFPSPPPSPLPSFPSAFFSSSYSPFSLLFPSLSLSSQTLAGFNDLDNFCDVVDALEEQGIEQHMDVSASFTLSHRHSLTFTPSHPHTHKPSHSCN